VLACVRQGQGVLTLTLLFSVYMDVLINSLHDSGFGCKIARHFSDACYMHDIISLFNSVSAVHSMFKDM